MYFSLQASMPRTRQLAQLDDELYVVIEELFLFQTEDLIMNWNGFRIPLEYSMTCRS